MLSKILKINNIKYLLGVALLFVVLVIYIYRFRKVNQKQSKTVDTITDKNMLKFMTKISKKCKPKNTCLVSYNQVQYLKDLIQEKGLKKTIKYLRGNPEDFKSDSGESPFIFHYDKESKEFVFTYHSSDALHNKNMKEVQKVVNKTCEEKSCPVKKTFTKLAQFSSEYGKGFYEYKWFQPKTKDIVIKRTFIEKVEISEGIIPKKIKNTGKKGKGKEEKKNKPQSIIDNGGINTIYIGSGSTVQEQKSEVDIKGVIIIIGHIFVFMLFWELMGIDTLIDIYYPSLIFIVVLCLHLFNLANTSLETKTIDKADTEFNNLSAISISFASLGFACFMFISRVLSDKPPKIVKNAYKLLVVSISFSLISFINYKLKRNSSNIVAKIEVKNGLLINSIVFLLTALLYVYRIL